MRSQTPQRQRRLAPRGQRRAARPSGGCSTRRREDVDRRRRTQDLDVVEDEDELVAALHQRVRGAGEGGEQVLGIVVGAIERDPCERTPVVLRPFQQRGRLAVARRRDQERERGVVDVHEPPHEPRARHEPGAGCRATSRAARRGAARPGGDGEGGGRGHELGRVGSCQHRRPPPGPTRAHAPVFPRHTRMGARMPRSRQRSGTLPVTRVPSPGADPHVSSPSTAARRSRVSVSQPGASSL